MKMLKKAALVAAAILLAAGLAPALGASADKEPEPMTKIKEYRLDRTVSEQAAQCIQCHAQVSAGLTADWAEGRHAHANITCLDCHAAGPADVDASRSHLAHTETAITPIVSPRDCSRCHPAEAAQYARSKHANTLEIIWKIDPWLKHGMNNDIERATGCYHCHGSHVKLENGEFDKHTWPNVGVGRINPDGSKGSCSSCHTRHRFALAEARKPEACGQCHLGPDHPQIEIYDESKHGAIYHADGHNWNWDAAPASWTPGIDYRTPTCAVCHMSGAGGLAPTHDVTERLAWETQAPLTIRPADFKPFPAKTDWKKERQKMKKICLSCHSEDWADGHFRNFDAAVRNYNELYYKPTRKLVDRLYQKNLLSSEKPLDEKIEIDMYEFWHHEGRRARFGAAMMAPDYAWWHGFYELKKRSMAIQEQAQQLLETQQPATVFDVKGTAADTTEHPVAK